MLAIARMGRLARQRKALASIAQVYGHHQILQANPSLAISVGRGDRSPFRSQAHRKLIRLACDQVGERSPGYADHKVRQQ